MEKREMTAREYVRAQKRMCKSFPHCGGEKRCPFFDECGSKLTERGIEIVEKWAAEHPEETLVPLGKNIYFDPKHRIVADEITEVYTFEITYIDENGGLRGITSENVMKNRLNADDVKLVRAQQFITKSHEEEM